MFDTNYPMVFWCYCIKRRALIINATIRVNKLLRGKLPHSRLTGQPTKIYSICEFGWYNWVIYHVEGNKFTLHHQQLGRALGPSKNAGSDVTMGTNRYWIYHAYQNAEAVNAG